MEGILVLAPIRGLREKLGLDQADALDDLCSPKTQMAAALAATKHESQVYAGSVPAAEVARRRKANKVAVRSRRINRRGGAR